MPAGILSQEVPLFLQKDFNRKKLKTKAQQL